jgi:hypothetical protein
MAMAIFSALQDTRRGIAQVQTTLEGLPTNLEAVCRTSTKEAIHEAITELKEEAFQAVGGNAGRERGFRNGEAEKIISQLVDQLAEQERLKEEEEEDLLQSYAPLEPTVPYTAIASSSMTPVPYTSNSAPTIRSLEAQNPFDPSLGDPFIPSSSSSSRRSSSLRPTSTDAASLLSRRTISSNTHLTSDVDSGTDSATDRSSKNGKKRDRLPPGAILFLPKDPFTNQDLIDPVLASGSFEPFHHSLYEILNCYRISDGLIHDRWSLVDGAHDNVRDPSEPLVILGDVIQLREAIFQQHPERRIEFEMKRKNFREVRNCLLQLS